MAATGVIIGDDGAVGDADQFVDDRRRRFAALEMLAIMGTASGRRSLTGRWICIVLGSASFVALIHLITS